MIDQHIQKIKGTREPKSNAEKVKLLLVIIATFLVLLGAFLALLTFWVTKNVWVIPGFAWMFRPFYSIIAFYFPKPPAGNVRK